MIATLLSGCTNSIPNNAMLSEIDTASIVEETVASIMESIENEKNDEVSASLENLMLSPEWEYYVGDFETFTYGLISNELKYKYDVFPAFVELSNGTTVSGIAYTDYQECYVTDDESNAYFAAGLIPYFGELDISEEDFNQGLVLYDFDYRSPDYGFVLTYESDAFTEHCVVYGKYLKYGVDEAGRVFYETEDFSREKCDTSLGSLYSFDEKKYLYNPEVGEYVVISGTSLSSEIDYALLEEEINAVLRKQDYNFSGVNVETYAYVAQTAIQNYLRSMQEATFMGYSVPYLVELAGQIDPNECYRITSDGLIVVDGTKVGNDATALVKWLVGTGCVIVTAVGMVGAAVFIECPPLSAAAGAIAGTAIEIFMQVVVSGQALDSVSWNRVALAAAAGAVSGFLGPYVMAQYEGIAYFAVDSVLDGVIGGMEKGIAAWLEGESGQEIIKEFGYGVALGFGLSAGFKCVGKVIEKAVTKVAPSLSKMSEKVFPKLTKKVSDVTQFVGEGMAKLKKAADSSVFHSRWISDKLAWRQISRILDEGDDELLKKSLDSLTANKEILDADGNVISKQQLKELFSNALDGDTIGTIKIDGEIIRVVKENGVVGIYFDATKYQTVTLPKNIIDDRDENFTEAARLFKESWLDDPSLIPDSIKQALRQANLELEDLMPKDLVAIIQSSDMVLHENIDLRTITLVTRSLHDKAKDGIAHLGGFALAKYLKEHMGAEFWDRLLSAASSAFASGG